MHIQDPRAQSREVLRFITAKVPVNSDKRARMPFVMLLVQALLLSVALVAYAADNRTGVCLSRLQTSPEEFEVCKTEICWMFCSEIPFVVVPELMERMNNQTPFLCKDAAATFNGLRGIFFQILGQMKGMDSSYCVYAGNQCKFNNLLELAARPLSSTWNYRFGVGGMAFILPSRIQPTLRPVQTILEGKFTLIGKRVNPPRAGFFANMVAPFSLISWVWFFSAGAFLFGLWILIVWRSTGSFWPSTLAGAAIGDIEHVDAPFPESLASEEERALWRQRQRNIRRWTFLALATVCLSAAALITITILLWELTAVHYLFEQRAKPTTFLQSLSRSKLENYTFIHGGATEIMFRRAGMSEPELPILVNTY